MGAEGGEGGRRYGERRERGGDRTMVETRRMGWLGARGEEECFV